VGTLDNDHWGHWHRGTSQLEKKLIKQIKSKQTSKQANKQTSKQAKAMQTPGAFVLKMKTRKWRLCVVKQVPAERSSCCSSCWMLFGQSRRADLSTFQMEFQPEQETTLINHLANMADTDECMEMETQIRLVLVRDAPAVSCIESLWPLEGQEMYRKQLGTASALINSLHQDVHMLCISPQQQPPQQQQQPEPQQQAESKSRHHMKTRSQTR